MAWFQVPSTSFNIPVNVLFIMNPWNFQRLRQNGRNGNERALLGLLINSIMNAHKDRFYPKTKLNSAN